MLRALALCLLTALPAAAQDFRGLRPGMHASALGPIGEPMEVHVSEDLSYATFPLPFGHRLSVGYDAEGTIKVLQTSASMFATSPPDRVGLTVRETDLQSFAQIAGYSATRREPGLAARHPIGNSSFELIYDGSGDHRHLVVILTFSLEAVSWQEAVAGEPVQLPLPSDATLQSVQLIDRELFDQWPDRDYIGGPRSAPIPFPLSIDEAFPSLIP